MTDPFAPLRALKKITNATERAKALSAALKVLPDVANELKEARHQAVTDMRGDGMSHADVAAVLGISRARAQQIAEGRTTGKRKTDSSQAVSDHAEPA